MVEDAKMSDAEEPKAEVETTTTAKPADDEKDETKTETPPLPPLEAAALRLERLLSDQVLDFYTNPVKVVRRWLGTSSGAAAAASAADISSAAANLLDPAAGSNTSVGRALLVGLSSDTTSSSSAMDTSGDGGDEGKGEEAKKEEPTYLTQASAREVESWLLSLAVRLLWKEGKHSEAFELSQKGIEILQQHLEEQQPPSSSLFPLLARLFRLRSLAAESMRSAATDVGLRVGMARAHNVATLRRDVDTQATLLNCMLRDLLRHSQST